MFEFRFKIRQLKKINLVIVCFFIEKKHLTLKSHCLTPESFTQRCSHRKIPVSKPFFKLKKAPFQIFASHFSEIFHNRYFTEHM